MKVWYMAHPIATDEHFTFEQNLEHIVEYTKFFWDLGINVIAPYHTLCLAVPDDGAANRERGLLVDEEIVKRIGRMILVGHKISSGMERELKVLASPHTLREWEDNLRPRLGHGYAVRDFTLMTRKMIKARIDRGVFNEEPYI